MTFQQTKYQKFVKALKKKQNLQITAGSLSANKSTRNISSLSENKQIKQQRPNTSCGAHIKVMNMIKEMSPTDQGYKRLSKSRDGTLDPKPEDMRSTFTQEFLNSQLSYSKKIGSKYFHEPTFMIQTKQVISRADVAEQLKASMQKEKTLLETKNMVKS